jgi:hypothetical protein
MLEEVRKLMANNRTQTYDDTTRIGTQIDSLDPPLLIDTCRALILSG